MGTANKIVETSGKFQEFQGKYKDYMSRKKAVSLVFVTCGRRYIILVIIHIIHQCICDMSVHLIVCSSVCALSAVCL